MTDTFRALCAELIKQLQELHTMVWGEAPHLLDEDRGGSAWLDLNIEDVLGKARALLAQPEPVAPTDEELIEPIVWMLDEGVYYNNKGDAADSLRELIARWGTPAAQPVPVSERLPGPEDCAPWPEEPDVNNWCWAAKCVSGGWEWTQLSMLGLGSDTLRIIAGGGWTHWAPHWALPVPAPANTINQED